MISEGPPAFHLLAKPTGAACNLACKYCFYLSKEVLYPGSKFRMTEELMEEYIRQTIEAHRVPDVTIAWQGGEPTLMGMEFFRKSMKVQDRYRKPGMKIQNTIQTNGVLLDTEWCKFFHDNHFLVGLSLDGPRDIHDAFRVDSAGRPTFDRVMRGLECLKKNDVEFNILTAVHSASTMDPVRVYRFLRDEAGARFIQFIPIVERISSESGEVTVTGRSVKAKDWGNFLIEVFDEWVRKDVGNVFIQYFEEALAHWVGHPPSMCILSPTCGNAPVLEHNGDVYSCDHFVDVDHLLGDLKSNSIRKMISSDKQRRFGRSKLTGLPTQCKNCGVEFACFGECPRNRFITTSDGEPGLNYLCEGYMAFFQHIDKPMRLMASQLANERSPSEIMKLIDSIDE